MRTLVAMAMFAVLAALTVSHAQTRGKPEQLSGPQAGQGSYLVLLVGPGPSRPITFATLGPNVTVVPSPSGFPILDAVVPPPVVPTITPRTFGIRLLPVTPAPANGVQSYNLPEAIEPNSEAVWRNGVRQERTVDYNITGTVLTFVPYYDNSDTPSVLADYQKAAVPVAKALDIAPGLVEPTSPLVADAGSQAIVDIARTLFEEQDKGKGKNKDKNSK